MRKLTMIVVVLVGAVLLMGAHGGGSPMDGMDDHPAKYGLCTAYFSGEGGENGNKHNAPPFEALESAPEEGDSVEDYCQGTQPGNGHGNGGDNNNAPGPTDDRGNGQG
jgi:hypothetical protein